MNYILGIDIGTTHMKVGLADDKLKLVKVVSTDNPADTQTNVGLCYSADRIWNKVQALIREISAFATDGNIIGIGVTGMADSGLPIDMDGTPLYPIIPWSNSCGAEYEENVLSVYSKERLYEVTGQLYHPKFALSRLQYIAEHEPSIHKRMACWLSLCDFIVYRLTGECVTDCSLAGRTLMYDINEGQWDTALAKLGGVVNRLPRVVDMGQTAGRLKNTVAKELTVAGEIPVFCCGHDHLSGLFALHALGGGGVLNSLGTSEVYVGFAPPSNVIPLCMKNGISLGRISGSTRYWMANLPSSGASIEWLKGILSHKAPIDYSLFDDKERIVDSGGVVYIPHINGSGTPHPNSKNKGMLLGLTTKTDIYTLIKAVYEGVSMETRWILESIELSVGVKNEVITAVGGGARNEVLMQTKADVTGKTYALAAILEMTLYGAILQTAKQLGIKIPVLGADKAKKIEPVQKEVDTYAKQFGAYKQLHSTLAAYVDSSWQKEYSV